jgi:Icc-related predicted phosphoesterase
MKLWILSDLHLEYAPLKAPLEPPDADVCVVAGDLCRGIDRLAEHIAHSMPCVYVAGKHEFHEGSINEGLEAALRAAKDYRSVRFLENEEVTIRVVRYIGATLWTDFRIEGPPEPAMDYARTRMNDYRKIAWQKEPWQRFLPLHAYRLHQDSRAVISSRLDENPLPTVVVTHHLPHPCSVPGRFKGDLTKAAHASDLSSIIKEGSPSLWVNGHMHDSCDYIVGNTRVLSNPRGYGDENSGFKVKLVVQIEPA